jgi:hypothetical protein
VPRINTQRSENTPVQVPVFIIMVLCLLVEAHSARALDHDNLDPNRPIAIEDAYVIPKGEIGVEGGLTFNDRKEGKSRFGFQPQIIYGAFDNTQIEIMSGLVTEPSTVVGDDKSGDLSVAALYNFNAETLAVPAFAARVEVGLPTGVRSKGIDTELTGVVTRSFGRWRTHVNVGYTFLGSPQQHERSGTYRIVAAVSYPLGYPMSFTDTLIVNAFIQLELAQAFVTK